MSPFAQGDNFSFAVGSSRLGDIPRELQRTLVFPGANPLVKQEDRTLVWRLQLAPPELTESSVVKLYRRRAAWHRLQGGVVQLRVQREFSALCALADGGVPCSAPLLWGWGLAREHGRFELIVTREITGAVNLKERLAARERTLRPDDLLPLFVVVRRMHECGVYHGALSPKNILAVARSGGGHDFHLIDLARAVCFPKTIIGTRMARLDLLSLLRRLRQLRGDMGCEPLLLEYGLPRREIGGFLAWLQRFRPNRHTRNWLALRFGLQARIARLLK